MSIKDTSLSFSKLMQSPHVRLIPWFLLSFGIWCYAFRGFLTDQLALSFDAVAYYEHIKFFLDRLSAGEFALWDPSWSFGVPNEFFLRRMGEFNPFWLLVIVFKSLGLTYNKSYFLFLALYYWIGAIGFYLVSFRILKEERLAFLSYLLFLFSSFGTLLFKSFMVLLFVPIVWFFVFLIGFVKKQDVLNFMGLCFSLMIILTTYIPLYFLTLVVSFVFLICIFYPRLIRQFYEALKNVFRKQSVVSVLSLISLLLSTIPAISFAQVLSKGDLVVSTRMEGSQGLEVEEQTLASGGIPVTTVTSGLFNRFEQYQAGRFYIPILIFVFLALGFWVKIDRLLFMLFLWGLLSYLLGLYDAFPLYPFLYKHVFFFKYFRNFQFFLWVHILPLIILIAMILLKRFLETVAKTSALVFITIVHCCLLTVFFILKEGGPAIFAGIFISYIGFLLLLRSHNRGQVFLLFFIAVISHPLEVFFFMQKNAPLKKAIYSYEKDDVLNIRLADDERKEALLKASKDKTFHIAPIVLKQNIDPYYFGSRWGSDLRKNLNPQIFDNLPGSAFQAYDCALPVYVSENNYDEIGRSLGYYLNQAYVETTPSLKLPFKRDACLSSPDIITDHSEHFKILDSRANQISLSSSYEVDKLLLYFNHFDKAWRAYIDGIQTTVYKTQGAFLGVVVPAGDHKLDFKYGTKLNFAFKFGMLLLYYVFFMCLIVGWIRQLMMWTKA
jgi:hypothetical protein